MAKIPAVRLRRGPLPASLAAEVPLSSATAAADCASGKPTQDLGWSEVGHIPQASKAIALEHVPVVRKERDGKLKPLNVRHASVRLVRLAFRRLLSSGLREGRLEICFPDGTLEIFGDGNSPNVRIAIRDLAWSLRLLLNPEVAVGDAYTEGALVLEQGDLRDLAELLSRNGRYRNPHPVSWWRRCLDDRLHQWNKRKESRRNVAHHYDLTLDFYKTFLDDDLQYSCAYFSKPDLSLEEAQFAKKRLIARKLLLRPGLHVLDIGCGWGGLAIGLAKGESVDVDGITLSIEQRKQAAARVGWSGLEERVKISVADYRDIEGLYDRIVSVGMFEHVGRPNFPDFFLQIDRHLQDDGVALIHTIGRSEGPGISQKWVQQNIFPGGYIPALSEIVAAVEQSGLIVTDVEVLRLHYAETLRHWLERFRAERARVLKLYDERFFRMWEFYLCASEAAFRHDGLCVFQLQLAKRVDTVPLTRRYLNEAQTPSDG